MTRRRTPGTGSSGELWPDDGAVDWAQEWRAEPRRARFTRGQLYLRVAIEYAVRSLEQGAEHPVQDVADWMNCSMEAARRRLREARRPGCFTQEALAALDNDEAFQVITTQVTPLAVRGEPR
jgi:hypothetical protein